MITNRAGAPVGPSSTQASSRQPTPTAAVRLVGVRKEYPGVAAVAGVDLTVESGEFFTLLGPSGSGKTTLLRIIAVVGRPAGHVRPAEQHLPGVRALEAGDDPQQRRLA